MCLAKKNGGVISTYYSVLLGMISIVIAANTLRLQLLRSMVQRTEEYHALHLIYLEMIYYIRNEINDEYYQNFSYDDDGISIEVVFSKNHKQAMLQISYHDHQLIYQIEYDKECRCILTVTIPNTDESVRMRK